MTKQDNPYDMELEKFLSQKVQAKTAHIGGRHAVMADVAVKYLSEAVDKDSLRAMVTVSGGEIFYNYD